MSKRKRPKAKAVEPQILNLPPQGSDRRWARLLIWAVLLANLAIPLKWYLASAENSNVDERFTWRMFSAYSMRRTKISLTEVIEQNGKPKERQVELSTIIQPSWAELLEAYHQPALIRHLLSEHCRQTGAVSATFTRTGTWSDGKPIKPSSLSYQREGRP